MGKQDVRDFKNVKVMTVADVAGLPFIERKNALLENRYCVFLHNTYFLCGKHGLTQVKLCKETLNGLLSPSKLTGYKKVAQDIPMNVMVSVATAFGLTVEEMCGTLLDEKPKNEPNILELIAARSDDEYQKCVGTYRIAYFDSSKPLGKNLKSTPKMIRYAMLTVYPEVSAWGKVKYKVVAYFNCSDADLAVLEQTLQENNLLDKPAGIPLFYKNLINDAANPQKGFPKPKCFYKGDLQLTDRMMEFTLRQVKGSDVAHIIAHNRAATSSEGKDYLGGLGTMMSITRGEEHMPCVQSIVLSRNGFANWSSERIAEKLYFAPPSIHMKSEIQEIVSCMKALFLQDGTSSTLKEMAEDDKDFFLGQFVERKLQMLMKRNVTSFYKVSLDMDSALYQDIRR